MDKFDLYRDIASRTGGDVYVGVAHIGALHILEELPVEVVLKCMLAFGERAQRQLKLTELSHSNGLRKNFAKLYNFLLITNFSTKNRRNRSFTPIRGLPDGRRVASEEGTEEAQGAPDAASGEGAGGPQEETMERRGLGGEGSGEKRG